MGSRRTIVVAASLAAIGVAAAVGGLRLRHAAHGTTVHIEGRSVHVGESATLAGVAAAYGLRAPAGNLLDVNGAVLRRGVVAGRLLLDGHAAPAGTRLQRGDRITLAKGRDRTERVAQTVVRVSGGAPGNPQFTVTHVPGEQIVVRGAISYELVSARFRPTGQAQKERAVALTFDDGPSPQYTPQILSTLRRLHVHATFFVVGYLAETYPDLVRREARLGMTVGNHSYNHPEVPPFDQLPDRLMTDEISLDDDVLERLGVHPALFRPPGGRTSTRVVRTAAGLGQRVVLWSVDPTDWKPGTTKQQLVHRVLSAVQPGSIVILHDGGGDRSATAAALPAVVRGIRKRGLTIVALAPGPAPVALPP